MVSTQKNFSNKFPNEALPSNFKIIKFCLRALNLSVNADNNDINLGSKNWKLFLLEKTITNKKIQCKICAWNFYKNFIWLLFAI